MSTFLVGNTVPHAEHRADFVGLFAQLEVGQLGLEDGGYFVRFQIYRHVLGLFSSSFLNHGSVLVDELSAATRGHRQTRLLSAADLSRHG